MRTRFSASSRASARPPRSRRSSRCCRRSAETGVPAARPFRARFVAPLLWATSLNPVNSSILATSLVAIGTSFGVSAGQTASLVAAVYVASAVAQPAMGRLGGALGARRVLLSGLVILIAGGIVGALAPSFGWLVVSRVLIGVGTASGYPSAMSLVRARAEQAQTGIPGGVLGGISIAAQVTAALGLPLGGVLVAVWGWPAVFAVNIPLGLVGIALVLLGVPREPRAGSHPAQVLRSLDLPGVLLFAAAVVLLFLALGDIRHPNLWLWGGCLAALGLFVLRELRALEPFIDLRLLGRSGPLVRTYLRQLVTLMAAYTVLYGYVQWLEQGRGLGASISGLVMLPMSAVAALSAAVISRRAYIRIPLLGSAVAIIVGGVAMIFVGGATPVVLLVALSLVFGCVMGLNSTSNQAALYTQTTADQIGVASGLLRTASYLGAILASAVIGLVFPGEADDAGLHSASWVLIVAGVIVLLMVALDRTIPRRGH